ncbi:lysophospholipid acyltransferase family protein [Mesorhizobium sp. J18]|uniref:lysophospholipid acyltransferase family protein n=1 Tax=Mesorhizobium sp. J18 TaxID=935263 RepID=UPI0011AB0C54|nr:lysophospholipid acyltransferase family protein [Mesorhizobium sp. J18]
MEQKAVMSTNVSGRRTGNASPAKRLWRRIRKPLAESRLSKNILAALLTTVIRFVKKTNPPAAGSHDVAAHLRENAPSITALWHGQHLLSPAFNPPGNRVAAMVSRSADAELNALVLERFGFIVARGSGGRESSGNGKGGARALIALKRALDDGSNVAMIADVPHGTPRQSGLGIVTLARISGRPILPMAMATSRRKVLERSWDKTVINLPFGRSAIIVGEPIFVPADADDDEMERKRREVTDALNRATQEAYRLVDGVQ